MVSALMFVVVSAMLSLQTFVLNGHVKQRRREIIFTQTVYSVKLLARSMQDASFIRRPDIGQVNAKEVQGYYNTNRLDNTPLQAGAQSYFLYCVNADGNKIYKYTGTVPEPLTFFPFYCGKPAEASQTRELLVDAAAGSLFIDWNFSRPSASLLHVDYVVRSGSEELRGSSDLHVQQSL